MSYKVTPLMLMDCQEAARLHEEAFFKGWTTQDFLDFLTDSLIQGLKITNGGTLLGYILWRALENEAEILTLVVNPASQKQGIGSQLLQTLIAQLQTTPAERLYLEVAEDNRPGRAFYQKHGFSFLSQRPNYYPREGNKKVSALNLYKKIT